MAWTAIHRWRAWLSGGAGPGWAANAYRKVTAWLDRHPTLVDAVLAAAVAAGTVPQLAYHARHSGGRFGVVLLFTGLTVVPLIWRRRLPLSTFAFVAAVAMVQWIGGVRVAADLALLVYLYTVASRYPMRVGVLVAGVLEVGALLFAVRWPQTRLWIETFVLLSGPVVAALMLGANVRHRRSALSALTQRAEQLERERDQQATIAAAEERTRIAREMHDVVAHSLSVMVTLSEGAARKQAADPRRAAEAIRQVSATGREALDEMRGLLGVLRTERPSARSGLAPGGENEPGAQGGSGDRRPQPGIAQLDRLLDQVRATGLAVASVITVTPEDISPGAELTVYRIVQEALTNTLKHAAGPTQVQITIARRLSEVIVEVYDDGGPTPGGWPAKIRSTKEKQAKGHIKDDPAGDGHGITGMRERAAVHGGTVSAGSDPAGGWRVRARLPLPESVLAAGRSR